MMVEITNVLIVGGTLASALILWNVSKDSIPKLRVSSSRKAIISRRDNKATESMNLLEITNISSKRVKYYPSLEIIHNYSSPYALLGGSSILIMDHSLLCVDMNKEDDYILEPGESRSYVINVQSEEMVDLINGGFKLELQSLSLDRKFTSNTISWKKDSETDYKKWKRRIFDSHYGPSAYELSQLIVTQELGAYRHNYLAAMKYINEAYKQRWVREFLMESLMPEQVKRIIKGE